MKLIIKIDKTVREKMEKDHICCNDDTLDGIVQECFFCRKTGHKSYECSNFLEFANNQSKF
jgi:uncharacterized protein YrrD